MNQEITWVQWVDPKFATAEEMEADYKRVIQERKYWDLVASERRLRDEHQRAIYDLKYRLKVEPDSLRKAAMRDKLAKMKLEKEEVLRANNGPRYNYRRQNACQNQLK